MQEDPILAEMLIENINNYHQRKYLQQLYETYKAVSTSKCFKEFVYGCLTGSTIIIYGQYCGQSPVNISDEEYTQLREFVSTRYQGLVDAINRFKAENRLEPS